MKYELLEKKLIEYGFKQTENSNSHATFAFNLSSPLFSYDYIIRVYKMKGEISFSSVFNMLQTNTNFENTCWYNLNDLVYDSQINTIENVDPEKVFFVTENNVFVGS